MLSAAGTPPPPPTRPSPFPTRPSYFSVSANLVRARGWPALARSPSPHAPTPTPTRRPDTAFPPNPQVIYLTKVLERTPATAALESTALTGLSYMCVLLGGYLADAALGRALTVLASGVLFTLVRVAGRGKGV